MTPYEQELLGKYLVHLSNTGEKALEEAYINIRCCSGAPEQHPNR